MKPSFIPKLINDPFSDPGLFILFKYRRRALLFDLGDISSLSNRDILKLTHVFVTHTHMDHFIGFDTLLRASLGRDKTIHLFGPLDFCRQIEGRLSGYTWNLVNEYETELRLEINEVLPDRILKKSYNCRDKFARHREETAGNFTGTLIEEAKFKVEAEILDHRIPCLALSLQESMNVNIIKEKLKELQIEVGPWINDFKNAIYDRADPESQFTVSWESNGRLNVKDFVLSDLIKSIAVITRGLKLAYITDAIASPENCEKIIRLAKDSDIVFIEAPFMHKDKEVAQKKSHLTAREAGELAARAGAKKLSLFHFSPRYHGNGHELEKEARDAYIACLGDKNC
jgi:ribonuclease Z